MVKYVYQDEETGEIVVRELSPEELEMIGGFYDLTNIDGYTKGTDE